MSISELSHNVSVSDLIDSFESYVCNRYGLFKLERTAPVLFEDEIADILRYAPDRSVISLYEANETAETYIKSGETYVNSFGHSVPEIEIISAIYDTLETECCDVYLNGSPIYDA